MRERQPSWQLHEIGDRAKELVLEFLEAHKQEQRGLVRRPQVRWSPPLDGSYKENFDTAIFEGSNCARIGVVYRDHAGNVIVALSQKIGSTHTIQMAEALAARRAMVFARDLSLFNVIIEGDCLRVIQALNYPGCCNTLSGHIIDKTKRIGGLLQQ